MLSRIQVEEPPRIVVRIDLFIRMLCDELVYLLENKDVELDVLLDEFSTELTSAAYKTVLKDLISDVFEHTCEGKISIVQYGTQVSIQSHCKQFNVNHPSPSCDFDVKLKRVEEYCQKLHWGYYKHDLTHRHHIRLQLQSEI